MERCHKRCYYQEQNVKIGRCVYMKAKILILICFFVILIAGCSGPGGNGNEGGASQPTQPTQSTSTPSFTSTPVTTQPTNMTNSTGNSQDKEFVEWSSIAKKEVMVNIQPIMVSVQSKNWTKLESDGRALKNDSTQLLSQLDEFNVSQRMEEVQEKYRESLEDFERAGNYYESAGKNNSSEELSNAQNYLKDAINHLNNASSLLKDKFHSYHTSEMLR